MTLPSSSTSPAYGSHLVEGSARGIAFRQRVGDHLAVRRSQLGRSRVPLAVVLLVLDSSLVGVPHGHGIGGGIDELRVVVEVDLTLRVEPELSFGRLHGRIERVGEIRRQRLF
jgi:hypothetical protein